MSTGKKDFGSSKFTDSENIIIKDEGQGENRENLVPELNLLPDSEPMSRSNRLIWPKPIRHGKMNKWDDVYFLIVLELHFVAGG